MVLGLMNSSVAISRVVAPVIASSTTSCSFGVKSWVSGGLCDGRERPMASSTSARHARPKAWPRRARSIRLPAGAPGLIRPDRGQPGADRTRDAMPLACWSKGALKPSRASNKR
jgi:hypothetical protein